jgi:hypothetical protein
MSVIERFVILMYDNTSVDVSVDVARMNMFTSKTQIIDRLPPTQGALVQHVKRAIYQADHVWAKASEASPTLPSPGDWGWKWSENDGQWKPFWTELPEASVACRELVKCGCRKGCKSRCSCVKNNLTCTALCACKDNH